MTLGELLAVPISTTVVANLAPTDLRGRYMSIYAMTWGIGSGIAPIIGGWLNDSFGPRYIWVGGFVIGLIATATFLLMDRRVKLKA